MSAFHAHRFALQFDATLWVWAGKAAWYFVTVPPAESAQFKEIDCIALQSLSGKLRRGWGSIPAQVSVGGSNWATSIFPDKATGCYFLPIKASVRKAEALVPEQTLQLTVSVALP